MKIVAIGNSIMGDDGIALKIVEKIEEELKGMEIEIIIGETDFEYCLRNIEDNDFVLILDSAHFGKKIGTITLFSLEDFNFPIMHTSSQHELSLLHMIKKYRKNVRGFVIGIEVNQVDFAFTLSDEMFVCLGQISKEVLNEIKKIREGVQDA
ncbi:hydrogenase maturation protease [Clostridiaceae bacterium 35-E11]